MRFSDYQRKAVQTALYPFSADIVYPALGLASEAGEVLGKIKKFIRGDQDTLDTAAVGAEIGDVLWYCAALARDLGLDLDDIAKANIKKVFGRKERDTIMGDGDIR